jgi:hypothetical protein
MKKADFMRAIEILSNSHSVEMIINYVKPNGQVDFDCPRISIISCPARAVHNLMDEGYKISMSEGRMNVNKYS